MLSLLLSCASLALPQEPAPSLLAVPLAFERHDGGVFLARIAGHSVTVDAAGATVRVRRPGEASSTVLRTEFVAGRTARLTGVDETPCKVHCFLGNDPQQWRRDIATFARVRLDSVWPGIDVVWHGRTGSLEYDFVVAPGTDPAAIRLRFSGAVPRLDDNGDLVQATTQGEVRHRAPIAWQPQDGVNVPVAVRYAFGDDGVVGFALGAFDRTHDLVIDPVVLYTARLDGLVSSLSDQQASIAVDAQGQAVVAFQTASPDLPTSNPIQATPGSVTDVFVAKFNAAGTGLVFATYLGGSASDTPGGVAVMPNGEVVVACRTGSPNYPLLNAAFPGPLAGFSVVAGVTVLSSAGALVWSTYYTLPTATNAPATDVATDAFGNVVICGSTNTLNLPTGAGAFQTNRAGISDAYVARFSSGGSFLGATYYGLTGVNEANSVAVASNGNICVGGRIRAGTVPIQGGFQPAHGGGLYDAWIAVFNQNLTALAYATYVGGSNNEAEFGTEPLGVAADAQNRVVLASATVSNNLPTSPGAFQTAFGGSRDGFVAKVDPSQTGAASRVFVTYLGGTGNDGLDDVALDAFGNIFVGGGTRSIVLPYVHPTRPPTGNPALDDALLAVLSADGSTLRFASPLGPAMTVEGIAVAADGSVFVAGSGTSNTIPVTVGAFTSGGNNNGSAVFAAHVDVQLATRRTYGQGHPGTLGVPSLVASADPVFGTTFDFVLGNAAGQPTFALLAVGLTQDAVPTPFGGTLLVGTLLGTLSLVLGTGGGTLPLALPGDPGFLGLPLFAQQFQIDVGASHDIGFSAGLALRVGI